MTGRKRVLYISSPIGLGHARRDVAIARELRQLVDGVEIDWLAQDPVTRVLEREGERVHPASRWLANESGHFESESAEHDLHCFQAWRRMDEILITNFMVFHDVVSEERYDLWIGDEAWELDYYLHENPGEKRAHYAWLTDFVGWLPMEDGGDHEAFLTADYNAEMVEHIATHPEVRDRALFVGNPDDIVPDRLGPDLPLIRDWTEGNFDFAGYVSGFDPDELGDRERLRAELGYGPDEQVCLVTVGGSGVGRSLLLKLIAAFPAAKQLVPELRMIVVAGPRIDPASLPDADGLDVRPYVHDLYRHLAACDLAVVQGGLTTSMELTANRRPFLYFPLKHHFEQSFHVRHRLDRYGAGRLHGLLRVGARGHRHGHRRGDRARGRLPARRDRRRAPSGRAPRGDARMRAAQPDETGTRSGDLLGALRRRRADGSVRASVGDRPLAHLEDAGAVLRPPLPRRRLRSARQRALRAPAGPGRLLGDRVRRGHARGHGRERHRAKRWSCRSRWARSARCSSPTLTPSACSASLSSLPRYGSCPITRCAGATRAVFEEELDTEEGWAKLNAHYWRRDFRGFLEFFFSNAFTEPHSTKQVEDAVGWGLETDPETLIATALADGLDEQATREIAERISCPVLVIHGDGRRDPPRRRAARSWPPRPAPS